MKNHAAHAYVNAYVDGRLAGVRHVREQSASPEPVRPKNPYGAGLLTASEWERGFTEGVHGEQARTRRAAMHSVPLTPRAST